VVFFKTARKADRLIEGLQAQGVPYVFGVRGAKIADIPVDYRHSTDIAAQVHEDVLL
jgi:thiamine pyrophosphate-dependent acetolactate synthase large subunit-like protein